MSKEGINPAEIKYKDLKERLLWTTTNPPERGLLAHQELIKRTDLIRSTLLPRYQRNGTDLEIQLRLINRAHMHKNEHLVLHPSQAEYLINKEQKLPQIDRLDGVLRSSHILPIYSGLACGVLSPDFEDVPDLMNRLGEKAEELFPWKKVNNKVDKDSIYYYASAFQYVTALIHPFQEANGRTSEDFMYALWERRPDLAFTKRFISSSGERRNPEVTKRAVLIDSLAQTHMHQVCAEVSHELNIDFNLPLEGISFKKVASFIEKNNGDRQLFSAMYLNRIAIKAESIINILGSDNEEASDDYLAFTQLATHLKNCSPQYWLKEDPSSKTKMGLVIH